MYAHSHTYVCVCACVCIWFGLMRGVCKVLWVISFYLKGFFPSTDDGKRARKMINRLEADCEERLKELWIFAWSQKADM